MPGGRQPSRERGVAHLVGLGARERRLRVARADGDVMAERREAGGDRSADDAGAEDGDLH